MRRTLRYYRLMWLHHDLAAGLSVFLVALPLCLGIALASGAPLYSGIMSGIIGGIVVSLISGSPLSVSGPAAGLTTLVAASILILGDFRVFLLTVIVAGLFQLILGVLKLGVIAHYFPSAVIKGMLAGIGILLIASQVPVALGYDEPDFWTDGIFNLFTSKQLMGGIKEFSSYLSAGSVIICVASLLIMLLIQKSKTIRKYSVPAPLAAVLMGILLNWVFAEFIPALALQPSQLVNIPSNIFAEIQFPDFSRLFNTPTIWKNGIAMGLLASLETLLCVEAIDKLDKYNRITPVNREMVAQGVGNMACGFLGAIPLTAVIVRGSANVDAGGRTRLSAITHGVFLLLAVLFIPFLLNKIPYPALAAILLVTGYNLTRPKLYTSIWRLKWKQFIPFTITIVFILITDLLIGVTVGLLAAIYFVIQNNFREEFKVESGIQNGTPTEVIKLNTNVTFLNKVEIKKLLENIPENSNLTIDGSEAHFVDYDVLEIISEFENKAKDRNINLQLIDIERVSVTAH